MTPVSVPSDVFRRACAKFATGITVVTVDAPDGTPHGFTANSFTSVSLTPPLVLVCVDLRSTILPLLQAQRRMGVSILRADQRALSSRFATRHDDRFDGVTWHRGEIGVPLLGHALATFECDIPRIVEAGDHLILLGEVRSVATHDGSPLLYFDSGYRTL